MNFKIVSNNKELLEKATSVFNILGMKESIHIQDVNFWLVDVKTIDQTSILSYQNRMQYANILFVINSNEEVSICLENGFTNYINIDFSNDELKSWCKFFENDKSQKKLILENDFIIDFKNSLFLNKKDEIKLTKQEVLLLQELQNGEFVTTKNLANLLKLNSPTSIRTIINRIRKKTKEDVFLQKRDYGYKLNIKKEQFLDKNFDSYVKELEEQNLLMQEIVDSSPTFIVTFIHKQLYCINKSFREFLGNEIIKELWDEEKGDFFQLIKHTSSKKEELKQELFSRGKTEVEVYDFSKNLNHLFEVQSFYFENIDKHLLLFKPLSKI